MCRRGPITIVTLGVYGTDEAAFCKALREAGVDTFCDIRWRRGMRGSAYAFANSTHLQKRLLEMGIGYLHLRALAPPPTLRRTQDAADQAARIAKRQRAKLNRAFIAGYKRQCLAPFNSREFLQHLGPEAKVVALFCVERAPAACHRSLLAQRLRKDLGATVTHLVP